MIEILALATVIAPVTGGLVQAVKNATQIKMRYLALMAVGLGLTLGAAAYFLDADIGIRLWAGGVSGLVSVGLFELGNSVKDEE